MILIFPFILYALALNPFLGPEVYDDVVYYSASQSLAQGKGYLFWGNVVTDWPPLFSLVLSLLFLAGINSIFAAKLIVLGSAYLAMILIYQVLLRENRSYPLLTTLFFSLMPYAFIWSSRLMTDWPFIALTFLFFYYAEKEESIKNAILLGLLFFACMLTRYAGVFLIVPIIAKPLLKKGRSRCAGITLAIGLCLFAITWIIPILLMEQAKSTYYSNINKLLQLSFMTTVHEISDLFLNIKTIDYIFPKSVASVILIIPIVLCAIGFIDWVKKEKMKSTDCWVLATLAVSIFLSSKYNRYLIPIAPFLVAYLLQGFDFLFRKRRNWVIACGVLWGTFLFAQDLFLLLRGNLTSYGGLSYLISRNYDQFYKGYWRDLYLTAETVNESQQKGTIAFDEALKGEKYLWFFTKQDIVPLTEKEKAKFLLVSPQNPILKSSESQVLFQTSKMVLLGNDS